MELSEDSDVENGEAEVDVPDIIHLKPFDVEPRRSVDNWEGDVSIESSSDRDTECERSGNIEWCDCGKNVSQWKRILKVYAGRIQMKYLNTFCR